MIALTRLEALVQFIKSTIPTKSYNGTVTTGATFIALGGPTKAQVVYISTVEVTSPAFLYVKTNEVSLAIPQGTITRINNIRSLDNVLVQASDAAAYPVTFRYEE